MTIRSGDESTKENNRYLPNASVHQKMLISEKTFKSEVEI